LDRIFGDSHAALGWVSFAGNREGSQQRKEFP